MKYLLFIYLFLTISSQSSFAQIDEFYFYETFSFLSPFDIERTNNKGYLVSGIDNHTTFLLKIDSAFQVVTYKNLANYTSGGSSNIKNISVLTDTSFLITNTLKSSDDQYRSVGFFEVNQDGEIIQSKTIDIGDDLISLNSAFAKNGQIITAGNSDKNALIVSDSMLMVESVYTYQHINPDFRFRKIYTVHDSLFILLSTFTNKLCLSTLNQNLDVTKNISLEFSDWSTKDLGGDIDLYVEKDSIYILNNSTTECAFLQLDIHLNLEKSFLYEISPSYGSANPRIGFERVDSSGFIFYASNSLVQSSRQHQLINVIGMNNTFLGIETNDTSTVILYKNGFTPAALNSSAGAEFVILNGNAIDSVLHNSSENYCIYNPYEIDDPVEIELIVDTFELSKDTIENFQLDSVSDFTVKSIEVFNSCPEAPWSTQNNKLPSISISPNPAINNMNIRSSHLIKEVQIININGAQILKKSFNSEDVTLEILPIPRGIYFLRILSNDKWLVKKIIISG